MGKTQPANSLLMVTYHCWWNCHVIQTYFRYSSGKDVFERNWRGIHLCCYLVFSCKIWFCWQDDETKTYKKQTNLIGDELGQCATNSGRHRSNEYMKPMDTFIKRLQEYVHRDTCTFVESFWHGRSNASNTWHGKLYAFHMYEFSILHKMFFSVRIFFALTQKQNCNL